MSTSQPVRMWPFWCYFGGKWRSAPRYPNPIYGRIVEPFAGAAGYATRHYARDVVLVEIDPVIAGLWRWLISATSAEIEALPLEIPSDGVRSLGLRPEAEALIGFWLNKGTTIPRQRPSAWMRAGTHAGSFWGATVRGRIASQVAAIKHWTVFEASYDAIDLGPATYFVDPPYERAGRNYRHSAIDYQRLSEWCQRRTGQVIVCEEEGATWLPFQPHLASKSNQSRTGGKVCHEVMWTSNTEGQRGAIARQLEVKP